MIDALRRLVAWWMIRRGTRAPEYARARIAALADRVEAATGPDRELDISIKAAIYGGVALLSPFNGEWCVYRAGTTDPRQGKTIERPRAIPHEQWIADRYTASLDAAMTLVPAKWRLRQMNYSAPCADDRKWHLNLHGGPENQDTFVGRGATPALALTAAALRARSILQQGEASDA